MMKSISALELISAIGGLIFFVFLVIAICSKSRKKWDQDKSDELDESKGDGIVFENE